MTTLHEARERLMVERWEGTDCPCCGQRAQVYKRSLHSGMGRALVIMYRAAGTEWQDKTVTLRGVGAAARDESLLRYWGLLEEAAVRREDGGRAGWWRVTDLGRDFVLERIKVDKYVYVYDRECLGSDGPTVSIRDCLGTRFDLRDLLGHRDP